MTDQETSGQQPGENTGTANVPPIGCGGVTTQASQQASATPPRNEAGAASHQPVFSPCPGETPRAFSAFMTFFQLGHGRSLQSVAEKLGENPATVKNWSSKYDWSDRIQSFNSGILQQQFEAEADSCRGKAADWARRTNEYREQEWAAAQKLLGAVQCFLENFGDRDVEKMTLAQVSRALQISSKIARLALSGNSDPEEPPMTPLQMELAAALKKAYGQPGASFSVAEVGAASPGSNHQP